MSCRASDGTHLDGSLSSQALSDTAARIVMTLECICHRFAVEVESSSSPVKVKPIT
jgi:hypothetical protein